MGKGDTHVALLALASHAVDPIALSEPIQKTSRCVVVRDSAARKEAVRAALGGVMGKGVAHLALLALASHAVEPIALSEPIQKTSRWAVVRDTAARWEAVRAALGGVMGKGVAHLALLTFASHAVEPIAPSGPIQKTSRC